MSPSEDEEVLLLSCAAFVTMYGLIKKEKNKRQERRWWITQIDLRLEESTGQFKNFVRMSSEDSEILINLIGPKVEKKNTRFHKQLLAHKMRTTEKLASTRL
nr:unnamed protein product [Callosobruchus chinensis]